MADTMAGTGGDKDSRDGPLCILVRHRHREGEKTNEQIAAF